MSVKTTLGVGAVWEEARKISSPSPPPPPPFPRAIIPVARPLGTFKNQDTVTVRRGISKRSHEKIGDCEQSSETKAEKTGCSYRLQATEPSINFIISKSVYCSSLGNQCLSEMINKVFK